MTQRTYAAICSLPLSEEDRALLNHQPCISPCGKTIALRPAQATVEYVTRSLLGETKILALHEVLCWLRENEERANAYVDLDCRLEGDRVVTTWRFSDASSALMFKLSLA